ncbi:2-hydroxyacid dehydrogenase [Nocardioides sp.]|uniref:2-hydroxyacid dehydrogenase n=1 Tax=Nocardioides sp. TaxID=35761 RepID=UPI003526C680
MSRLVWVPFDPAALGDLPSGVTVAQVVPSADDLPADAAEVELFVPAYTFAADLTVLARMPRLRVVQTLTAGIDHVWPHLPEGVTLCNGKGIHETSTAELALTLMLASLRGVPEFVRAQDRSEWASDWWPALADKRVLIVGHGSIGAAVEERLRPFEVEVVRVASRAREGVHGVEDLPRLLPDADVVVLVVPLTDATRGLVSRDFLDTMRPGALLVNVARGAVVDTDALLVALRSGRVRAALDVTDPEPLPPDHPLWSAPGVLISPHVGGASSAMWPRAYRVVREQLVRFAAGEPLAHVVRRP